MAYQLAHLNVALAKAHLEDPVMSGFFTAVGQVNAAAEELPGFIWRLVEESSDPTWRQAFPNTRELLALSVWEDLDSLRQFVYKSVHVDFLRRRQEWFLRSAGPNLVLWWIPAGHRPTLCEARQRLNTLAESGPTQTAFTFGMPFPVPVPEEGA